VTEFIEGISLWAYSKNYPKRMVDEKTSKFIFTQLIDGISYLHAMNIIHRDIKMENIIIDKSKNIKIIDFGFGTVASKTKLLNFYCGTPTYMPPEIVQKREYIGHPADIWSCGILLYTLLCGFFPFKGKN